MKICSWNIFEGGTQFEPLESLIGAIRDLDADVICLQETNGWHPDTFEHVKKETAYVFGAYLKTRDGYDLCILSKYELEDVIYHTELLWHGFISCTVDGIQIISTHLNPFKEEDRLDEIQVILNHVTSKCVILGDLNAISPHDVSDELFVRLVQANIIKFGSSKISTLVHEKLLAHGLIDLGIAEAENTVPTPACTDKDHAVQLRLDFMYATPSINISGFKTKKDDALGRISDHYPILACID